MSTPICYLVYASQITFKAAFNKQVFLDISQESQPNNHAQNISGFLCFGRGYFLQYIEGSQIAIDTLYAKLLQDPRHTHLKLLAKGEVTARRFNHWDMFCVDLADKNNDDSLVEQFDSLVEQFDSFQPLTWDDTQAMELVEVFERYYNSPTYTKNHQHQPQAQSYTNTLLKNMTTRHLSFIMLQLVLLVIVIICLIVLYLFN